MQWSAIVHVLCMLLLLRKGLRAAARVPATAVHGRQSAACYVFLIFVYKRLYTPLQSSCRDASWRMAARKLGNRSSIANNQDHCTT
jgi:hypothetical protein